jgi:hypothetical protein
MMTHIKSLSFICILSLLAFAMPLGAVEWKESPALLDWEKQALAAFDLANYDRVIEISQAADDDPNQNARLLIYFAHAQKYYMERNNNSAAYYKQHYNATLNRLRVCNLPVLTRLVSMPDLDWHKKVNKQFLDKAFENAGDNQYLGSVLYYLAQLDSTVSNSALKGLGAILSSKRAIVLNGGTLSQTDQKWMSDSELIKLLVKKTGENANPATGFLSKMPAFARKKVMGGAPACLALVEEPALPMLKEAAGMGNPAAAAAIQLIQDARGERLAKYPNSTWYSATGGK